MKKMNSKRQAILDTAYRLFRLDGFDKTSISKITAQAGGSKATIYSHFSSKKELFIECMILSLETYVSDILKYLDTSQTDPEAVLYNFGTGVLNFICSYEQLEIRRLMIAEARRLGTGKLFFNKITALRSQVSTYLSSCMSTGMLRPDDPDLAADHFGALLEAEILVPLLLHVREGSPNESEIKLAAKRAVTAFLRAYSPKPEKSPFLVSC